MNNAQWFMYIIMQGSMEEIRNMKGDDSTSVFLDKLIGAACETEYVYPNANVQ